MYAHAHGEFQSCPNTWTNKCYILKIRTKYDKMALKFNSSVMAKSNTLPPCYPVSKNSLLQNQALKYKYNPNLVK